MMTCTKSGHVVLSVSESSAMYAGSMVAARLYHVITKKINNNTNYRDTRLERCTQRAILFFGPNI